MTYTSVVFAPSPCAHRSKANNPIPPPRSDELLSDPLPLHEVIYVWTDTTLKEISFQLAQIKPSILPNPFVGTRMVFRHVYTVTSGPATARADQLTPPRYMTREMGSHVYGVGRPGASKGEGWDGIDDGDKTLAESKFIQGDYIICAILPPDELTGDVLPATEARIGRGNGIGEAKNAVSDTPPGPGPRFHGLPRREIGSARYGNNIRGPNARRPSREMGDPYPQGGHGPRHGYNSRYSDNPNRPRRERDMPRGEWKRGEIPGAR